jgi:hypothetical protein
VTDLLARLGEIAAAEAERVRDGGSVCGEPGIDVVLAHEVNGRTRAWFVFDVLVCHGVLSGSDNYAHHVLTATAELTADAAPRVVLEQRAVAHPTEFDVEWAPPERRYDRDAVRRSATAAWRLELGLDP